MRSSRCSALARRSRKCELRWPRRQPAGRTCWSAAGAGAVELMSLARFTIIPRRPTDRLLPLDCQAATEDILRRLLDSIRDTGRGDRRTTLLLLNLEQLSPSIQPHLLARLRTFRRLHAVICTIAYPRDEAEWRGCRDLQMQPVDSTRGCWMRYRRSQSTSRGLRIGWKTCRYWHRAFLKRGIEEAKSK